MRVLHRIAELEEQRDALVEGGIAGVAMAVDRLARHVFHREERRASVRDTDVHQRRDVGMVQLGERTLLGRETLELGGARAQAVHGLQCDPAHHAAVVAPREVDGTHATLAEQPLDVIARELAADGQCLRAGQLRRFVRILVLHHPREQLAHECAEFGIVTQLGGQPRLAFGSAPLHGLATQPQGATVALDVHARCSLPGRRARDDGMNIARKPACRPTRASRSARGRPFDACCRGRR